MNLSEYITGTPTVTLIKGEPGTGKTIAAASYPKPMYIISLDRKVGSIPSFYSSVAGIEYDFFHDFWSVYEKLELLKGRVTEYKTIILDPLTILSRFALDHSVKYRPEERAEKKDKEKMGRKRGGLMLYEIEDFGAEAIGLYKVIDMLKEINIMSQANVILIAHVVDVETMKKGTSRALVTGGKRIAAEIPGNFDEIYHTSIDKPIVVGEGDVSYKMITRHTGEDFARTALPIPTEIDFTNKSFYSLLQGFLRPQLPEKRDEDKPNEGNVIQM